MSKEVTIDKTELHNLRTQLNSYRRCIHQIERKLDKTYGIYEFDSSEFKEDIRDIIEDNIEKYKK